MQEFRKKTRYLKIDEMKTYDPLYDNQHVSMFLFTAPQFPFGVYHQQEMNDG